MKNLTTLMLCAVIYQTQLTAQTFTKQSIASSQNLTSCNCKQANVRFARLNKLNVTSGNNYRVTIEVNTEGIKCKDFKLNKLTINSKVINMPMTYLRNEEVASDGSYKLFMIDITMPEILPTPVEGRKFSASAVFSIGGTCLLKFPINYYGEAE
jgi:hypothetical protein